MTDRYSQIVDRLRSVTVSVAGSDPASVTEDVTFLDLGFDSMSMMQLAAALQDAFGVRITFRQLFDVMPTVGAVARHLDRSLPAAPASASAETGQASPLPISPAPPSSPAAPSLGLAAPLEPGPTVAAVAPAVAGPGSAPAAHAVSHAGPAVAVGAGRSGSPRSIPPALKTLILQQLDVMAQQLAAIERATGVTADVGRLSPGQPAPLAPAPVTTPQPVGMPAAAAVPQVGLPQVSLPQVGGPQVGLPRSVDSAPALAPSRPQALPTPASLTPPSGPMQSVATAAGRPATAPDRPPAVAALAPPPRGPVELAPAPMAHDFPMTEAQQELWFTSKLDDAASCALNESNCYRIDGPLDDALLASVMEEVLARHEALNVRFDEDGETQHHDPEARQGRIRVERQDLTALDPARQREAFEAVVTKRATTPFDLENGPLGHVHLLRLDPQRHLLLTYYHHIAYDGYSGGLLMAEVAASYNARRRGDAPPPTRALPFSAYVERQRRHRDGPTVDRALGYWAAQFPTAPPPLELPTRAPRGTTISFAGDTVHRELTSRQLDAVRSLARTYRTTISTVLLTAFELLLARVADQDEVVIGIPAAGQVHLGINCVGYCVNTLPIRSRPVRGKPFATLVRETQTAVLDAIDHQDVSVGSIMRAQRLTPARGRLSIVDVMFNFSAYQADVAVDGCRIVAHENRRQAVVHDMFLHVVESADQLILDWDFRTDLFTEQAIEQWMTDYVNLIETLVALGTRPEPMSSV